jgi:hypothetical protein
MEEKEEEDEEEEEVPLSTHYKFCLVRVCIKVPQNGRLV